MARLWCAAAMAAAAAWAVKLAMGARHPVTLAIPVLGMFGLVYFGATYAMKVPECAGAIQRLARLRR
jgi:putative peptidoglycan lipid II flippase